MRAFHDLIGMPLVAVDEGKRLGTLRGLEFDGSSGQVQGLYFTGGDGQPDGMLPWSAVRSVGRDAITVESASAVTPGADAAHRGKAADVRNRAVVTENGNRLGVVSDYDVDENSGRILTYHVGTGGLLGKLMHTEVAFPQSAIRAFGPDAIVVADSVIAAESH
jgi:uncharacterized protein YrrD